MGRKNVALPYQLLDGESMGASFTSAATNVTYTDVVGYQLTWTGTPTGTFDIEATVDGTNWEALTLSPAPQATGAAGGTLISLNQIPYAQVRLKYTRTSGTGSLSAWVMTKTLSA